MIRIGDVLTGLCFLVTLAAAAAAAYIAYTIALSSMSAPQQAAGFAMTLCLAVIPYVFSRAIEKLVSGR